MQQARVVKGLYFYFFTEFWAAHDSLASPRLHNPPTGGPRLTVPSLGTSRWAEFMINRIAVATKEYLPKKVLSFTNNQVPLSRNLHYSIDSPRGLATINQAPSLLSILSGLPACLIDAEATASVLARCLYRSCHLSSHLYILPQTLSDSAPAAA
jgi:hypothetical protein